MKTKTLATIYAILAATLYAINIPLAKIFLLHVDATMMAGLLYLGAGIGMICWECGRKALNVSNKKEPLTRKELPFTIAMVVLDVAAPIFLMMGIRLTNSANVSLLNNFEIVVTSLLALFIFKEVISKRMWLALLLVTAASVILTYEGNQAFVFNHGSLLVLAACACWGIENNCTKMISNKSSEEIVIIKGICSGIGSVVIALLLGERFPAAGWLMATLVLGFLAYGLSINFYIMAQKDLGAAKTSGYYSVAPFLGVAFSMLLLGERPQMQFYIALILMIVSTVLMVKDSIELQHTHMHEHRHNHMHRHGDLVHAHEHGHEHTHIHVHGEEEGVHMHQHEELEEEHNHKHVDVG